MENMSIYDKVRNCPPEALRPIQAGKLKGKSDINPMWRIKILTELFGPCGVGWRTEEETFWTTPGANGEVIAWCSLKLRYADTESGEWSDPVFGIGGSMLVDTQKGNLTSNDDGFKMAHTDAISVACKALGIAADVYWNADATKYTAATKEPDPPICERCKKIISPKKNRGVCYTPEDLAALSTREYEKTLCWDCMGVEKAERDMRDAQREGFLNEKPN